MEYRGIVREHKLWIKIVALIVAGLVIYRSIMTEQWIYILIGIVVFLACFFTKEHIVDEKGADIRYHLFGMNIGGHEEGCSLCHASLRKGSVHKDFHNEAGGYRTCDRNGS